MFYYVGRIFMEIFKFIKVNGGWGFGVINFSLVLWLGWKFATNHLKHLQTSIDNNGKKLDTITKKVNTNTERISFLEGRTE